MQALETQGKLKDVTANARSELDKLNGVKADLAMEKIDWQDLDFPRLIKALKKLERNRPYCEQHG